MIVVAVLGSVFRGDGARVYVDPEFVQGRDVRVFVPRRRKPMNTPAKAAALPKPLSVDWLPLLPMPSYAELQQEVTALRAENDAWRIAFTSNRSKR